MGILIRSSLNLHIVLSSMDILKCYFLQSNSTGYLSISLHHLHPLYQCFLVFNVLSISPPSLSLFFGIDKFLNWTFFHSLFDISLLESGKVTYFWVYPFQFSSVMSDSLWPHGLQHTRLVCSSPTPRACPNSCPVSPWCHPTISSSVIPFSSHLQPFPASASFPMSRFFTSGG